MASPLKKDKKMKKVIAQLERVPGLFLEPDPGSDPSEQSSLFKYSLHDVLYGDNNNAGPTIQSVQNNFLLSTDVLWRRLNPNNNDLLTMLKDQINAVADTGQPLEKTDLHQTITDAIQNKDLETLLAIYLLSPKVFDASAFGDDNNTVLIELMNSEVEKEAIERSLDSSKQPDNQEVYTLRPPKKQTKRKRSISINETNEILGPTSTRPRADSIKSVGSTTSDIDPENESNQIHPIEPAVTVLSKKPTSTDDKSNPFYTFLFYIVHNNPAVLSQKDKQTQLMFLHVLVKLKGPFMRLFHKATPDLKLKMCTLSLIPSSERRETVAQKGIYYRNAAAAVQLVNFLSRLLSDKETQQKKPKLPDSTKTHTTHEIKVLTDQLETLLFHKNKHGDTLFSLTARSTNNLLIQLITQGMRINQTKTIQALTSPTNTRISNQTTLHLLIDHWIVENQSNKSKPDLSDHSKLALGLLVSTLKALVKASLNNANKHSPQTLKEDWTLFLNESCKHSHKHVDIYELGLRINKDATTAYILGETETSESVLKNTINQYKQKTKPTLEDTQELRSVLKVVSTLVDANETLRSLPWLIPFLSQYKNVDSEIYDLHQKMLAPKTSNTWSLSSFVPSWSTTFKAVAVVAAARGLYLGGSWMFNTTRWLVQQFNKAPQLSKIGTNTQTSNQI